VARWNSAAWLQMGTGLSFTGLVIAQHPSGELLIGGEFSSAGGAASAFLTRRSEDQRPWISVDPSDVEADCGQVAS
ncbi:MAG: hypothetical protein JNL09_10690, partial [Anaerolineales bacterium]|nr:hypothetical protein [Anaerolineales bacterium]